MIGHRTGLLAGIVLLALVIRLGVVIADNGYAPAHDAFDYDRHAVSIADGNGYPASGYAIEGGATALRAPAYPYVLGATYALFGVGADGARVVNVLLGGLTVLLTAMLGSRIAGPRAGLIAGLAAALFPPLILISRDLFSENLFVPIALAIPLAALAFRDDGRFRWVVLTGVLCGLAALARNPGPAVLIPALIGVWCLRPRLSLRSLAAPAMVLAVAALTVLPWTIRNAVEFGRLIPVTTSTGFALAGTYNESAMDDPRSTGSWRTPTIVPSYASLFRTPGIDEGTLDATLRREATEFAYDHPGYAAEVTAHNTLRLFTLEGNAVVDDEGPVNERGIGSFSTLGERIALAVIAPFALLGIVVLGRRHRRVRAMPEHRGPALSDTAFVWLVPLLLLLAAALVAGLPRYRVPADPFLLILAAIGFGAVLSRIRRPRGRPVSAAATAVFAVSLMAAGCGSGSDETGTSTDPAPAPGEISKAEYVERADAICARSLKETRKLVKKAFNAGIGNSQTGTDFTTEQLVEPGLEIRRRLAAGIEKLPDPPADPDLKTFLDLFPATEAIIVQRLEAGRKGDEARSKELEALLNQLGAEQQQAAAAYGFDACAENFGSIG